MRLDPPAAGADTRPERYAFVGALVVFLATFLLRWLTIDFENDYFMHMAWAADMLRGERPVRDFVEPGFPLQTLLAFTGLRLGGYQLVWEAVIACTLIAAGGAFTYLICRAVAPLWVSLVVTAIAVATFPRMYTYPKAFVYPLALYALLRYVQRPSAATATLVGAATGIAFLFRHDHAAWLVAPTMSAFAILHWAQPRVFARAVFGYGVVAALLATPWLLWVGFSGHADQYIAFLTDQSRGLTNRGRLPDRTFLIDWSRPLVALAPIELPIVGIRWAPTASSDLRQRTEARYRLIPVTSQNDDEYRLEDWSLANVRALVADPAIEDTRGIDRGSLRVPSGRLPWLYLRLQQYLPPLRVRILPGIVSQTNAEPWLTWVTFTLPWLALGAVALRLLRHPGTGDHRQVTVIVATALLSIITYQTLVRSSPDSRLPDLAAASAVLLAWLAAITVGAARRPRVIATLGVVAILGVTLGSALSYGRVAARLADAGVDGPVNLARRASGQHVLYRSRPLDLFAPPDAAGLPALSRWLNACTREDERVSIIGFEPQMFFLAERGFAGGLAFFDLGWNSSERDQRLAIARWSRQRVPVVLAMSSEWRSFSRDYPAIRSWIDGRYDALPPSTYGGGKEVTVLLDKTYAPVGTHPIGLPCFR